VHREPRAACPQYRWHRPPGHRRSLRPGAGGACTPAVQAAVGKEAVMSEQDELEGSHLSCSSSAHFRMISAAEPATAPTRRAVWQGLAATAAVVVAGCARGPKPTPIGVTLNADAGINPNDEGKSSPVVVRLYELKGLKAFNNASFFDIMDDETK